MGLRPAGSHAMAFSASLTAAVLGLSACSDKPLLTPPTRPALRSELMASVVPGVAASLGNDGRFILRHAPSQYPEISDASAMLLANTWARQFGPLNYRRLESEHGGRINYHSLASCGRALYAKSAFQSVPKDVPAPHRRPYGPWYLVTLCDDHGPAVSLAVSAWATEVQVANGRIQFPRFFGNEFLPVGIPKGHTGEFPIEPENAVVMVGKTGRRATAVPELVMPVNTMGVPQNARWHVRLDGTARVRGIRSGSLSTTDVYVGSLRTTDIGAATFVPASGQPSSIEFLWNPPPAVGESADAYAERIKQSVNKTTIQRDLTVPLNFEPLTGLVPER